MSRIKISQLNATEFNALNDREMNEVVGGSINTQSAAIVSSTSNALLNGGVAIGVGVGQFATSINTITQNLSDNDAAAIVASAFAGIGG